MSAMSRKCSVCSQMDTDSRCAGNQSETCLQGGVEVTTLTCWVRLKLWAQPGSKCDVGKLAGGGRKTLVHE